ISDIAVERMLIYDISGRVILDLDNSSMQEGNQNSLQWNCCDMNGRRINSGMYMVRAECEYGSITVPFIILAD
ncbi:MAG: T9SS type A sorting domain-containing protein, partial [Candidatus Aegiribacteria sp.]|nr:T9SS type A sorting domain-containing protein [Candidatus Aegiribacteria sp.]